METIASRMNRRFTPVFLAGAVLFVALNAWAAIVSVQSLESSLRWVSHTHEVIAQIELVLSTAKDAETGSRGYVLTGQPQFLDPFSYAENNLPMQLSHLEQLTVDNASQQARVAVMRKSIVRRMADLGQINAMRQPGQALDASSVVTNLNLGKAGMDALRLLGDQAEAEERELLEQRNTDARRAARRVRYTLLGASALDLVLILIVSRYFARERGLRVSAETTARNLDIARHDVEARSADIAALNSTLEQRVRNRTAELEATNRELEAFSYSVSHDLRAPLRTIDGFSLALEEDYGELVGDEGKHYISRVRIGVQRMGGLIDALLQLSRITRAEITREHVNLSEIAEGVAKQLIDQNPAQTVEFTIEPGLTADADSKLIRVAFENLFGNAVKFSSKKPESKISFGWDAAANAWYIRDNGAGFDMHYKDKLFGAFNRLHGDKDFKGSGIGLATVARVIGRHHGTIWADSTIGTGATFWFTLG